MTEDRESGVDFGSITDDLSDESYPVSNDDLLAQYGDRELEHANGTVTVRELLEPLEDQMYESPDAIENALLNMVGDEAVGRTNYSDRGDDEAGAEHEQESF